MSATAISAAGPVLAGLYPHAVAAAHQAELDAHAERLAAHFKDFAAAVDAISTAFDWGGLADTLADLGALNREATTLLADRRLTAAGGTPPLRGDARAAHWRKALTP